MRNSNNIFNLVVLFLALLNLAEYRFLNVLGVWNNFFAWILLISAFLCFEFKKIDKKTFVKIKKFLQKSRKELVVIIILALATRFLFLNNLPFVVVGDSLREVGTNALLFIDNDRNDVFKMGSYSGYGNLMPFFGRILVEFLGTINEVSLLISATIGSLTIVLLYLFMGMVFDKRSALFSSLFMIFSSRHLYYSRTEAVIVSPLLFLLLALFFIYFMRLFKKGFYLFGLVMGLSFHFYVATRPIFFLLLVFLFFIYLYDFIKKRVDFKQVFNYLVMVVVGFVVGMGPALANLSVSNTGAGSMILKQQYFIGLGLVQKASYLAGQYFSALANNLVSTTSSIHYPITSPILEYPLYVIFCMSLMVYLINYKRVSNIFSNLFLFLFFSLPFFLQVLSSDIYQDQRNVTNILVAILFIFSFLFKKELFGKKMARVVQILLVFALSINIFFTIKSHFFSRDPYISHSIIEQDLFSIEAVTRDILKVKKEGEGGEQAFLIVSEQSVFLHILEKIGYHTHPHKFALISPDEFLKNKIYYEHSFSNIYLTGCFDYDLEGYEKFKTVCKNSYSRYDCPFFSSSEVGFYEYGFCRRD